MPLSYLLSQQIMYPLSLICLCYNQMYSQVIIAKIHYCIHVTCQNRRCYACIDSSILTDNRVWLKMWNQYFLSHRHSIFTTSYASNNWLAFVFTRCYNQVLIPSIHYHIYVTCHNRKCYASRCSSMLADNKVGLMIWNQYFFNHQAITFTTN